MDSPRDPAIEEIEEHERLEQFLAWRRTLERRRGPSERGLGWRWFTYGVGAGVLGTIFVALASLLNADLGVPQRLSGHSSTVPIAAPLEASRETPRPDQRNALAAGLGAPSEARSDPLTDHGTPHPGALVADTSGEVPDRSRLSQGESARAPARDDGPSPSSSTSPSLSLPDRASRGGRRSPSNASTLGDPSPPPYPAALPRPELPTVEYRSEQPDAPAAAPEPTPAPDPAPSVNPATIAPPPAAAPSAPSAPVRSRERTVREPSPDGAAASANVAPSAGDSRASDASTPRLNPAAASPPEVAEKPLPEPIETLKRLVDSVTDGKVGTSIRRWVTPNREGEATSPTRSR
jgi:hypothetical protein